MGADHLGLHGRPACLTGRHRPISPSTTSASSSNRSTRARRSSRGCCQSLRGRGASTITGSQCRSARSRCRRRRLRADRAARIRFACRARRQDEARLLEPARVSNRTDGSGARALRGGGRHGARSGQAGARLRRRTGSVPVSTARLHCRADRQPRLRPRFLEPDATVSGGLTVGVNRDAEAPAHAGQSGCVS